VATRTHAHQRDPGGRADRRARRPTAANTIPFFTALPVDTTDIIMVMMVTAASSVDGTFRNARVHSAVFPEPEDDFAGEPRERLRERGELPTMPRAAVVPRENDATIRRAVGVPQTAAAATATKGSGPIAMGAFIHNVHRRQDGVSE